MLPDKCHGCGKTGYVFSIEEKGKRKTDFRCQCGALLGGQSGLTYDQVLEGFGIEAEPPIPRKGRR